MTTVADSTTIQPDRELIWWFLTELVHGVYEVRIPEPRKPRFWQTQAMYLQLPDDLDAGADAIASVSGHDAAAVYIVGNPVNPALLGRGRAGFHRARSTVSDGDVIARRLLYVDIDAERPAGINATPEEAAAAMERTAEAAAWLDSELAFPEPLFFGTSGSGGMLLYRLDLPNDEAAEATVRGCLTALAERFPADGVKIDTGVANAARLFRVPGTVNAKSTTPQPDRPWSLVTGTLAGEEVHRG